MTRADDLPDDLAEQARLETIRDQVENGTISVAESVRLVPEWAPLAALVYADQPDELDHTSAPTGQSIDAAWDAERWQTDADAADSTSSSDHDAAQS